MLSDEVLLAAEYYKKLFIEEKEKYEKLDSMDRKLDIIIANQNASGASALPPVGSVGHLCPPFDEWSTFFDVCGGFDTQQIQYILVTDTVTRENLECYSILKGIAWKMVLDFDPFSEEKGFYLEFTSEKEKQSKLVAMFSPTELNQSTMKNLSRQIDPNKIQWVFVNGRSGDSDGGSKEFSDWKASSVKGISQLFGFFSDPDTFDKLKPVICLILPFSDESLPYLQVTLKRLKENFYNHYLKLVSVDNKNWPSGIPEKFNVDGFHLSPNILNMGFKQLLDTSADQRPRMPSSQAGIKVDLSERDHLYLKEHLEILYSGCENLPPDDGNHIESEGQRERFLEQQRKSFLSGNQISFASLFDNHDARREINGEIQIHVQRLLDQSFPRNPLIVEIRHSPGTGGTTIARRVLWNLHNEYPCALIDVASHGYSDEETTYVNDLAERIASLEEICNTTPLVLIDGKQSGAIESLSNKLARKLQIKGKRVVILRCLRGVKASSTGMADSSQTRKVFQVNVKLEESLTDLREFKSKYKVYLDTIEKSSATEHLLSGLCRVFHFPLLAMMEDFRPKLEKIIEDTFNELGGVQQEIAVVVAFVQKYTNLPTPALLLYEAFKQHICVPERGPATYDDIKQLFSDFLMNLMVPGKLTPSGSEIPLESYTFQHPLVADLILTRVYQLQKRDLFGIVEAFLQLPIYQQVTLLPLLFELFLYNKKGKTGKIKFSILFEELKENDSKRAAQVFCKASEMLNEPLMYGNAARFCARNEPPSFAKAKELIERAFQVHGSTSKGGDYMYKKLCHTKGVVLHFEMTYMINSGEVEDLKKLEAMASKALKAHREARNFPPTHPHPLISEVEVWLQCIKWITKNMCDADSDATLEFVTTRSPPFFRTCVSDSFRLLDIVDGIVQSVPQLADPEETKRLSIQLRASLMRMCRRQYAPPGRRKADDDVVEACKAICSSKHFQRASPLELKRLQAHFILSDKRPIDSLKPANLEYLLELLEELVMKEDECHLAHHLMRVSMLVSGPRCYSLKRGLQVCKKWSVGVRHDCLPDFYQMAIYFLRILDGNVLEFWPKYLQALQKCREKSQSDMRRFHSTHFVGKEGLGMSRLISRHSLLSGETDYDPRDVEKSKIFWQVGSRKKLLECKGRIRVKQTSGRVKSHTVVELTQGNVELYVGKNTDIGKVEKDFTPGSLVYFVVSFNLQGPIASGITFSPQAPENTQ